MITDLKADINLIWKQNRSAIQFVLRFLLFYVLGTILYQLYLGSLTNAVDVFTSAAAGQSATVLRWFGYSVDCMATISANEFTLFLDGAATVRVIEGCNSVAVILLFIAFVFGFKGKFSHYLWFLPLGIGLLWFINLGRIAWLAHGLYLQGAEAFYWQKSVFSASIYAFVCLLWLFWIRLTAKSK
jgi:exosortase family protein XrtF